MLYLRFLFISKLSKLYFVYWKFYRIQPINVDCRTRTAHQKSRNFEILHAQSMRDLSLAVIQQGNPKERIKHKIKSVNSGYSDKEIRIKGYPIKELLVLILLNIDPCGSDLRSDLWTF